MSFGFEAVAGYMVAHGLAHKYTEKIDYGKESLHLLMQYRDASKPIQFYSITRFREEGVLPWEK